MNTKKLFIPFIFILLICTCAIAQVDLTDGLVVHYPLNGNGESTIDGHPELTAFGSPTPAEGVKNTAEGAMQFDGSSTFYAADENLNLPMGGENRSFCIWAKFASTLDNNELLSYGTAWSDEGAHNHFAINVDDDENPVLRFGFWWNDIDNPSEYGDEEWHHFIYTLSGLEVSFFADGKLVSTQELAADPVINTVSNGYISVGGRLKDINDFRTTFIGTLDDIRIYNRVLTEADAAKMYETHPDTVVASVSVRNLNDSGVKVFPNPATNFVTVQSAAAINKVEVYNLSGRMVFVSNQKRFDTSGLDRGIYMLKIHTESTILNSKISLR